MAAGETFEALAGIAIGVVALLVLFVYPLRAILRTPRAAIGRAKWPWAIAVVLPPVLSWVFLAHALPVGVASMWLVFVAFVWRVRAPAWRGARTWAKPALAAAAALLVAFIGWDFNREHVLERERQARLEVDWPRHTESHLRLRVAPDVVREFPELQDGPPTFAGLAFQRFWPGMTVLSAAGKPVAEDLVNPLLLRIDVQPRHGGDDLQHLHDVAVFRAQGASFAPSEVLQQDGRPAPWLRITPDRLDEKDGAYGLGHVGVDLLRYPALHPSEYRTVSNPDIWFAPARGGPLQVFIVCPNDQVPARPAGQDMCEERFVDDALDGVVRVRFQAALLPQWRAIHDASERQLRELVTILPAAPSG